MIAPDCPEESAWNWVVHAPLRYWANSLLVLSTRMMPLAEGGGCRLMEDGVGLMMGAGRVDGSFGFLSGMSHNP